MHYTELPKEGFDKCIICGKKTKGTAFCKDCWKEHDNEELLEILNIQANQQKEESKCIVCGGKRLTKYLCYECFREVKNKQDEIDKNLQIYELKDYFYNLNSNIYRLKEDNYAKGQIYKLFAIAQTAKDLHRDNQLSDIVASYAQKIIEKRKERKVVKEQITEEKKRADTDKIAVANPKNRASDGHICKSPQEVEIDNLLYRYKICHAYGLKVKEIPQNERTLIADWYIPLSGTVGIYIEYWGMDRQDYQDNKEDKLKLYNKYKDKVKLIEIEKSEINDIQNLENNLYQRLVELGWKPPKE